jgi:putative ABC transport system ATP-binding protein
MQNMKNGHQSGTLIEAKNIFLSFGGKTILNNISFSVYAGDLIIIRGPSGGGKSTLLRILNRLQNPDSGEIQFEGKPVTDYKAIELRRRVCYLQQTPLMIDDTVKKNLLLPYSFKAASSIEPPDDDTLVNLLQQFQMPDISLSSDASILSVGQKQRIAFIRLLLLKPKVLLLDEPTSALDSYSREIVESHIEKLARHNDIAVIMVTHTDISIRDIEARKFELRNGTLTENI